MGKHRCNPPPEFKWGSASIGTCGSSVVDVDCSCYSLSPQCVQDLGTGEHGSSHVDDHAVDDNAVETLGDTVELQCVWGCWLMGNAMLFKVRLELTACVLATVVQLKDMHGQVVGRRSDELLELAEDLVFCHHEVDVREVGVVVDK